ncbi:uncharacterized protein PHALS_00146 [Plasmopara halstedii]|uniref:Uncharacterized protein n=1 Tax=Plasmopara halstedii TaxID=4781 RepID=A0A0P1A5H8_PLAHL|nr:uncharacterized protein PHALS_00146 [Plasmopara halstedii]CEG35816.1 hypothetical protein PHALS_00146 [Plasmopara halstedii]|eukprot:XP_024572185.1 hypothetical protein PHALS_00146 [Plasmopara halstedii]
MPYKWTSGADQIVRYCGRAVCKTGWSIHLAQLQRNLFDGHGAGYIAIAQRVLPMPNVVLHPGVYLVGVLKNTCGSLLCDAGHQSRRSDNP